MISSIYLNKEAEAKDSRHRLETDTVDGLHKYRTAAFRLRGNFGATDTDTDTDTGTIKTLKNHTEFSKAIKVVFENLNL